MKKYVKYFLKAKEPLQLTSRGSLLINDGCSFSCCIPQYFQHCFHFFPMCLSLMCFLFKPGLRCFSHIFAVISSYAISTLDLFAAASKNGIPSCWYCLLSVIPPQRLIFLQLCNRTACMYEACVRYKKHTEQTHFTTAVWFLCLPILSTFTLGGGCAIISWHQWWPCPLRF